MNKNFHYTAFLRGINVGGHARMKMADLRDMFETLGFQNVRTVLASGNVVFESKENDGEVLTTKIESELKKAFKRDISVILRSKDHLKKLQANEPFKGIEMTQDIQLYVTFLPEKLRPRTITIPYTSPQEDFSILSATFTEIFSIVDLSKGRGTPVLMNFLQKEYGTELTTRSWNTIIKILK